MSTTASAEPTSSDGQDPEGERLGVTRRAPLRGGLRCRRSAASRRRARLGAPSSAAPACRAAGCRWPTTARTAGRCACRRSLSRSISRRSAVGHVERLHHDDGVGRADLHAQLAELAGVELEREGLRVVPLLRLEHLDLDHLRRADELAEPAADAVLLAGLLVVGEREQAAEAVRDRRARPSGSAR